jgi:hypothetical protein
MRKLAPVSALLLILGLLPCAQAQPSLATGARETYNVMGVADPVVVYTDAVYPNRFYYVPNTPRLAFETRNGKEVPRLGVVGFAFDDPDEKDIFSGGLLNFAVSLSLPKKAKDDLDKQIKDKYKNLTDIKVSAVPMSNAKAYAFCRVEKEDTGGAAFYARFLAAKNPGDVGLAPNEAEQTFAVSLPLKKRGFDLAVDAALHDNLYILYSFDYECRAREQKFIVTVNWDMVYEAFEKVKEETDGWSLFGFIGDENHTNIKERWEKAVTSECVKVEQIDVKPEDQAQLDALMSSILKEISDTLAKEFAPPKDLDPAALPGGGIEVLGVRIPIGQSHFSSNYRYASSRNTTRRRGTRTWNFTRRLLVKVPTVAAGFVGIKAYATPGDKKNPPEGDFCRRIKAIAWDEAVFQPPSIGQVQGWMPSYASYKITLLMGKNPQDKKDIIDRRSTVWQPGGHWQGVGQHPENACIQWTLAGRGINPDTYKNGAFDVELKMVGNAPQNEGDVIIVKRRVALAPQRVDAPLAEQLVAIGSIDVSGVDWEQPGAMKPGLRSISWQIEREGQKRLSGVIKPERSGNEVVPPANVVFATEEPEAGARRPSTKLTLHFVVGTKKYAWKKNGTDIRPLGNQFSLTQEDIEESYKE